MCLILAMTPSFLVSGLVNGASDELRRSAERGDVGLHDEVLLGGRHVDLDRLGVHRGAAEQQEDDTERGVPEHRHDFLLPRKVNGRIRETSFSVNGSAGSGKTERRGPVRAVQRVAETGLDATRTAARASGRAWGRS